MSVGNSDFRGLFGEASSLQIYQNCTETAYFLSNLLTVWLPDGQLSLRVGKYGRLVVSPPLSA